MLIDLLFPKKCLGCGRRGNYICGVCIKNQPAKPARCVVCEKNSIDGMTHFKCRRKFLLDGVVSIWSYEKVIRKSLLVLKYKFAYDIAQEIAEQSAKYIANNFTLLPKKAVLIPIPIHITRQRWRGFNQADQVGKLISHHLGWKFSNKILYKKTKTLPQTNLLRPERKRNLKNVFVVDGRFRFTKKDDMTIILFDDVCTTGTTLKEAGKALKRAGARKVWGLTIAR